MPLPRPLGSGIEKILVSSHKIPKDQVLHFILFSRCCSKPRVHLLTGCFWLFFFLGHPSPGLPLFAFCTPLSFPARCPTILSEVSHFITIVTLHLSEVAMPFPLCAVVSVPWWEGWLLVLLVPWGCSSSAKVSLPWVLDRANMSITFGSGMGGCGGAKNLPRLFGFVALGQNRSRILRPCFIDCMWSHFSCHLMATRCHSSYICGSLSL